MSLQSVVTARVPNQTLVDLTNQKDTDATTVDTTILGLACTDVEAEFEVYTGLAFDATNAKHVPVGVAGVLMTLREWIPAKSDGTAQDRERWVERCRALARVTSRDRIRITSSSELTPSDEVSGTAEVRPYFDRQDGAAFIPEPNSTGSDDR
jgi:hypothetical protein